MTNGRLKARAAAELGLKLTALAGSGLGGAVRTTFTIGLHDDTGAAVAVNETIYWSATYVPA